MTDKASFSKCNLIWTSWWKKKYSDELAKDNGKIKIYGRMDKNKHLADKKCLFSCFQEYYALKGRCVFKERVFPITFHIVNGTADPQFANLAAVF